MSSVNNVQHIMHYNKQHTLYKKNTIYYTLYTTMYYTLKLSIIDKNIYLFIIYYHCACVL